ncbi:MAG: hypothetical protein ACP5JB_04755 [candidate division WOR-3 bacterium]|jgi:hypothetical protein
MNLIIIFTVLVSGVDIGGRVGVAFPTAGINRYTRSSTVIGLQTGYSFKQHRLELGYSYLTFPGRVNIPYELNIYHLSLLYENEFFHRPAWGISAGAGAGFGFIRRSFNTGLENGRAPNASLVLKFIQHEGRSRVSAGLDNMIFFEKTGSGPALTYFPMLRAEVAYVF